MPRFAANLSFLFTEAPFLSRFALAAQAGFTGVEFHYPYGHDPYAVRAALDASGLSAVLINVRAGDHAAGEWGFAGVPGREETFRLCVDEAVSYAAVIGAPRINCLAGVRPNNVSGHACAQALTANLGHAARVAAKANIAINLEPLNTIDVPGYLVGTADYARYVIEQVGEANLGLQYDWYHATMMGADLRTQIREMLPVIRHMQFADAPGRNQPGSGEIDFPALFTLCDELGYQGWLAAEYRPLGATDESLAWLPRQRAAGVPSAKSNPL
jgi:hydroxypyruvate isomerase